MSNLRLPSLSELTPNQIQIYFQEQVLGIEDSSDSSDDSSNAEDDDLDFVEEDIIEKKEETLPDERRWGKNKRMYFGTDTSDDRIQSNY